MYLTIFQDALRPDRSSATHFGLPRVSSFLLVMKLRDWVKGLVYFLFQALEEVQKIRPKRTLFTGMLQLPLGEGKLQ